MNIEGPFPISLSEDDLIPVENVSKSLPHSPHPHIRNSEERVKEWLQQYGFYFNPFQHTSSEQDKHLNRYFVEHAGVSNAKKLEDRIIFAQTGDGKSAVRLYVQSLYRDTLSSQHTFCFSYLIPQSIAESPPSTCDEHFFHLIQAAIRHIYVLLAVNGRDLPDLKNPAIANRFAEYFDRFLGVAAWREHLLEAWETHTFRPITQELSPTFDDMDIPGEWEYIDLIWLKEWLDLLSEQKRESPPTPGHRFIVHDYKEIWQNFLQLVIQSGLHRVMVLIDGFDAQAASSDHRNPGETHRKKRMVGLAQPLIRALRAKELGAQVCLKIFLPRDLYLPLSEDLTFGDPVDMMDWNNEQLNELLSLRLATASDGAVTRLAQLMEPSVHESFEAWLLAESQTSPRVLLHIVNKLLRSHVLGSTGNGLPGQISRETLAKIVTSYSRSP